MMARGSSRTRSGSLREDLRQAIRSLARAPTFTLTALLVLALGIGVNASTFTALRLLVLTPPPYPEPDRIVMVATESAEGVPDGSGSLWSYPAFRMLADADTPSIAPVAGFLRRSAEATVNGASVTVVHEFVSHTYLELLGALPEAGRFFSAEDDDPSSSQLVTVISHCFWTASFGGSPGVVGQVLLLGGREARIVGVANEGFGGLTGSVDAWLPLTTMTPALVEQAGTKWFQVVGRLAPTATIEAATSWGDAMLQGIRRAYPSSGRGGATQASVRPLPEARSRPEARAAVWAMAGAALLLLLIGCTNLAGPGF
jgi:hypothetical protein